MNQFLSTFTSKVFSPVCVGYYTDKRMHYQVFVICVAIFMCESNQEPRFFAECTGITTTSPTLILLTDTFDSCLLVPITKNSVVSSFNINLSLIIHERTSAMQFSISSSASASHVPSNGRNDKYNLVSSAYECVDGG